MNKAKRAVIIGLDGVPYGLLKEFSLKGIMPNLNTVICRGTFKKMRSSIPDVSSVAWSSVITGVNPAAHGIFGFTDIAPGGYRLTFPNFANLKADPFWQAAGRQESIILNVPSTYPARELNGILISGFVALDLEKAVYPRSLLPHLRAMGYSVDVDAEKAHQSLELFLRDLCRTTEARISLSKYLWGRCWKTFMIVFTGTDRLMHFMYDAYEDEGHPFRGAFENYFKMIDGAIGELIRDIKDTDTLIILSDHGFERLDTDLYINSLLEKEGFLKFKDGAKPGLKNIDTATKAFALDPARIYVNLKGRYPNGSVQAGDREKVIRALEGFFGALRIDRKKAIKASYRREDIYKGPYLHQAPDLILAGEKGFNLKASFDCSILSSKGLFAGKHTQDDAFILAGNKVNGGILPEDVSVADIVGITDRMMED